MRAEYLENKGCLQRDSAEREEYAGARSIDNREAEEADGAELLKRILDRGNLNRAYKRVKANKGAPGIDGSLILIYTKFLPVSLKIELQKLQLSNAYAKISASNISGKKHNWVKWIWI